MSLKDTADQPCRGFCLWHNDLRIKVGDYGRWNYAKGHYTFARLLSENGYQTAISGKPMALGDSEKSENVGFDEHYIHIDENIKLPKDGSFDGLFEGKWNFPGSLPVPSRFWHPAIVNNGELVETSQYDFGPDLYTDFVIDFMKRNSYPSYLRVTSWRYPKSYTAISDASVSGF